MDKTKRPNEGASGILLFRDKLGSWLKKTKRNQKSADNRQRFVFRIIRKGRSSHTFAHGE